MADRLLHGVAGFGDWIISGDSIHGFSPLGAQQFRSAPSRPITPAAADAT